MRAVVPSTRTARAAVALAGGVVAAVSLPPWGWWPLGIAGLALFALALRGQPLLGRMVCGAAFGVGMFAIGLWWVTEFHAVGYVALLVLETSFFVAGAAVVTRPVVFPAAIVLAEFARGAVPFGGLPLGGLALGQAAGPFVAAARLGGALVVLGVVACVAAAIVVGRRSIASRAALIAFALVVSGLGWVAPAGYERGALRAAVVQGGGPRGFRAVETDAADVFEAHLAASSGIDGPVELVLWPENTVDVIDIAFGEERRLLAQLARDVDATVIAGVTQDAGDNGFENAAVAWSPAGEIVAAYSKVRRVPFGEYVPMRTLVGRLVDLSVLPRDAVAGRRAGVMRTPAGTFAVAISYEVFFGDRTRSGVRGGGEVLLVPTNAASFTTSQVPTQEVAAARLRAWETGRWVLQAAPTGYSAVIDERGRVLQRSVLGRAEVLSATVPRRQGKTIATRLGDWPVIVLAVILLLAVRVRGSSRDD